MTGAGEATAASEDGVPSIWVDRLSAHLDGLDPRWRGSDADQPTRAAVLVLLSDQPEPDLVLTVRSATLRHHAGQVAFPGGQREVEDPSPVSTALRETREEIGLGADQVTALGQLSSRDVWVSANLVVPVVGLWKGDAPISPQDSNEVAQIVRWPLATLADPSHRVMARHPAGGVGPAWQMGEVFMWGLTANVVDAVLRLGGWELPWDKGHQVEVPPRFRR